MSCDQPRVYALYIPFSSSSLSDGREHFVSYPTFERFGFWIIRSHYQCVESGLGNQHHVLGSAKVITFGYTLGGALELSVKSRESSPLLAFRRRPDSYKPAKRSQAQDNHTRLLRRTTARISADCIWRECDKDLIRKSR